MKIVVDSSSSASRFKAGVSLHSHTLHSRESLAILYSLARRSCLARAAVRLIESNFRQAAGIVPDLNRGWWTPPLSAFEAWQLERRNVERNGLAPLVSITDHDNIDGPLSLCVLGECRAVPISVEWTVPFEDTFFHLGIHDLPRRDARSWMDRLARFTASRGKTLPAVLEDLCGSTDALIVMNHPLWDEGSLGASAHEDAVRRFLAKQGAFVHALEVNGLRPWSENRRVLKLAQAIDRPVISGGDRHGYEPNAVLNVTCAATFGEFAEEVRCGHSNILITESYREAHSTRILRNFAEMAGTLEGHAHGWCHWSERVFYEFPNGAVKSVQEVFGGRAPEALNAPFRLLSLVRMPGFSRAIRLWAPGDPHLTPQE